MLANQHVMTVQVGMPAQWLPSTRQRAHLGRTVLIGPASCAQAASISPTARQQVASRVQKAHHALVAPHCQLLVRLGQWLQKMSRPHVPSAPQASTKAGEACLSAWLVRAAPTAQKVQQHRCRVRQAASAAPPTSRVVRSAHPPAPASMLPRVAWSRQSALLAHSMTRSVNQAAISVLQALSRMQRVPQAASRARLDITAPKALLPHFRAARATFQRQPTSPSKVSAPQHNQASSAYWAPHQKNRAPLVSSAPPHEHPAVTAVFLAPFKTSMGRVHALHANLASGALQSKLFRVQRIPTSR
mmetsp:Transcript_43148/g.126906  ORF Transcript_43148/g.126906 Transcript_43148/m.126906 type:complete len:301 (+) Transcript_43148:1825-2727(+)